MGQSYQPRVAGILQRTTRAHLGSTLLWPGWQGNAIQSTEMSFVNPDLKTRYQKLREVKQLA